GKPVLFCLGPSNERGPSFDPSSAGPDVLEGMLDQLGIKLPKQTVLFDVEAKSFGERRGGVTILGGTVDVPSVDFDWPSSAGLLRPFSASRQPQPIREGMRLTARSLGKDQPLELRLRHPRPVYYEPPDKEKLNVQPEFMMSSPMAWNEAKPF